MGHHLLGCPLVLLTLLPLATGVCDDEVENCMHLLQTELTKEVKVDVMASTATAAKARPSSWTDHVMAEMEGNWTSGRFSGQIYPSQPGCGQSTFRELQLTIPVWQQRHPGVDGFCHFSNHAWWFTGAGADSYREAGRGSGLWHRWTQWFCDSTGELSKTGPEETLIYDAGRITLNHVRSCIDVVDDPYCYSLGWLKGQGHWEESLMDNKTAWQKVAQQECARLKEQFQLDDEEVTVGRHIFTTPEYFRRTWSLLRGTGALTLQRLHVEHVYTKCQLGLGGGAPMELAYCFYKGCVLPGNRIGHADECGYDQ
mmetsp:Transcript_76225/g.176866  ORF Transcript_76225/g.176866 Transcript_76225/m.176866 type:complete len:312 (+) Transcript_76225:50-985(+)